MESRQKLLLEALYGRAAVLRTAGDYKSSMLDLDRISVFCREKSLSSHNPVYLKSRIDYAHLLSLTGGDHAGAKRIIVNLLARHRGEIRREDLAHGVNTLGIINWLDAKNDRALRFHRDALSLYKRIRDRNGVGRALGAMGVIYQQQGKFGMALKLFKEEWAIAKTNSDILGIGVALNHLGMACHGRGDYGAALKYFKMNLDVSERIGYKRGVALSYSNIGVIYRAQGKIESARQCYERALAESRSIGYQMMTSTICNSIGLICLDHYRYRMALKYFRDSLDAARQGGYKLNIVIGYGNIGLACRNQGKYNAALEYFNKSLGVAREIRDMLGVGYACFGIASVNLAAKRSSRVLDNLKRAIKIFDRLGEKAKLAEAYVYLANHYCNVNRFAQARGSARKALVLAEESDLKRELLLACRAMARSWMPVSRGKADAYSKRSMDFAKTLFNKTELRQYLRKYRDLGV